MAWIWVVERVEMKGVRWEKTEQQRENLKVQSSVARSAV